MSKPGCFYSHQIIWVFINIEMCHVSVPNSLSRLAMWTVSVGGKMEKANWENSDRGCHRMSLTQTLSKIRKGWKSIPLKPWSLTDVKGLQIDAKMKYLYREQNIFFGHNFSFHVRDPVISLYSCGPSEREIQTNKVVEQHAGPFMPCYIHSKEFMSKKRLGLTICLVWRTAWWKIATQECFTSML